jgi:hypothetical protein
MPKSNAPDGLVTQAQGFAARIQDLLDDVLPGSRRIAATVRPERGRVSVQAVGADGLPTTVPIRVGGEVLAEITVSFLCGLDWTSTYLKVEQSKFGVNLTRDRHPLARLEFDGKNSTAPTAHWHFHGERREFTQLLSAARQSGSRTARAPDRLSALHFPVGGERWRPCLEDFLQFLVEECGADANEGWREAVSDGREIWRRMQMRALVRDLQVESAERLRQLGWTVTPPPVVPDDSDRALHLW